MLSSETFMSQHLEEVLASHAFLQACSKQDSLISLSWIKYNFTVFKFNAKLKKKVGPDVQY